jgi:hypothetical protein
MSGRLQEKDGRREGPEAQEPERPIPARRHRVRPGLLYFGVGAIVVAAIAAVIASGGGGSKSTQTTIAAPAADGPFSQHYAGLVERRQAAHVPTMMDTMTSSVHFHPLLKVYVSGKQMPVPADIGIDPTQDPMQMAGLHTHDTSGTIHVEGVTGARLGQFFRVWGVPLSATQLGPYRAGANEAVRMWVDGKPSTAFGHLKLADGQRIVVSFGPKDAPAPGA